MKRLKLKKSVKRILIISLVVIIFLIVGINYGVKTYKQKQYEKTYEYKLVSIGYDIDDVKVLLSKLKDKEINYLLENKKDSLYLKIINEKYFIYDKFYDYVDYYNKNKTKSFTEIVEIINTNRDKDYYTNTLETDTSKGSLMLTNKYYYLSEGYTPLELTSIPLSYAYGEAGSKKVTKDTYDAFVKMWNASHEAGYYLMVSSAYRDYESQVKVYEDYKKSKGEKYADSIAARPGYSEHQTGYALDIFEKGITKDNFKDTDSYRWLNDNAYKYGFIERYPIDKENITGYAYESWHFRYVGVEAATYIHNNHISFDEYYAYFVK